MTSTVRRGSEPVYGIECTGKASKPYLVYRLGIVGSPRVWLNTFEKHWQATTWVDKLMVWNTQWSHPFKYDSESIENLASFWQAQHDNDYVAGRLAAQREDWIDVIFWQQEQATDHRRAWAFLNQLIYPEGIAVAMV